LNLAFEKKLSLAGDLFPVGQLKEVAGFSNCLPLACALTLSTTAINTSLSVLGRLFPCVHLLIECQLQGLCKFSPFSEVA
jgi:hypothetical protein